MPADLLSVQPTHRHQRPGCDFDVEELVRVTGPLDGIPGDTKRKNTARVKRRIKKNFFGMEFLKSTIQRVCVHLCDKPSAV